MACELVCLRALRLRPGERRAGPSEAKRRRRRRARRRAAAPLDDHRADRKEWLLRTLGVSATDPARYAWELVEPGDPDHMDRGRRLLHVVADRLRWQTALTPIFAAGFR